MRRLVQILACSAALAAAGLLPAVSALASGSGTSAGDQQYVDPLTATTPAPTHTSPAPTTTSTLTTQFPSSSTSSSSPAPATTTATTQTSTTSTSGTLPYTGLNVGACVAVGLGMLGTGLLLRRLVAQA